jgi:hypothetical protein
VNNLLVLAKNVYAEIHNIHVLVGAMAHDKDTPEHLQEVEVRTGGRGGGTTAVGSTRRSYIQRRGGVAADWSLGKSRAKRLMCRILIEPFMSHHLDHAYDIGRKSTRSKRVDSHVPNLVHYVVKEIKVPILHDGVKKVPLIGRYGV